MECCSRSSSPLTPAVESCCSNSTISTWQKTIDMICRIALGILSAWIAPQAFAVSLLIGIVGGILYTFAARKYAELALPTGDSKPVCAQGYMDFLSQVRFPPAIASIATTAFIATHIRHDPFFFIPFCGFFLGFGLGHRK